MPTRSSSRPPNSGNMGVRLNGINPDEVFRGSGILAADWAPPAPPV